MCSEIHKFEKAGMGKAPFKYLGIEFQDIRYGERVLANGCTTKPGGTCAYCGTYIVNMYQIESADGIKNHVGSECIKKVGDAGLIKLLKSDEAKARRAKAEVARKKKYAAFDQARAYLRSLLETDSTKDKLEALPHPSYRGKTLLDYYNFILVKGGLVAVKNAIAAITDIIAKEPGAAK